MEKKNIRIVQFCPYYPPHVGGLENYLYQWSQAWRINHASNSLLNIIFVTNLIKYEEIDDTNWLPIPCFELVSNFPVPKIWSGDFWKTLGAIRKYHPSIIQTHTRFFLSSILGGLIAKLISVPWVHVEHGSDHVVSNRGFIQKAAYFYDKTFGKWSLKNAKKIVSISQATAQFVERLSGVSSIIIPPGVKYFGNPGEIKKNDKIRLVFASRIVKLKGYDILVRAIQKLLIEHPELGNSIELNIYGDGPEKENFEALTQDLQLPVLFHGFVSHTTLLRDMLPLGDILIVPSLQEGFGLIVIEGLLAKMVVIASHIGGIAEMKGGKDLILCPVEDIPAFSEALHLAIQTLPNIRGASFASIKDQYNWENTIHLYEEVYQKI